MAASDGTLVIGTLNGDRAAFAELYDRRARLIRAICHDQTRDWDAACDLTQEVFLRAYRDLRSLRDPQKFGVWLTGIARQVCREWRRRRMRDRQRVERLAEHQRTLHIDGVTGRDPAHAEELAAVASRDGPVYDVLSERQRLAVHAYYLNGCNVEEARTLLGLSRATFFRVLSSACAMLRAVLSGDEVRR